MLDRSAIERGLESGRFSGPAARLASLAWARLAGPHLARPLNVPPHARVVSVGGATLGGSWKTPLALLCAARLAGEGARVALVGHAYRARPGRARFVEARDPVAEVGDEALACLACAREMPGSPRVEVVVGPSRQQAFDLALTRADRMVLDGASQLTPRRADLALLVVDKEAPWGAGACPPAGDLRALPAALIAASDRIVVVGAGAELCEALARIDRPVDRARAVLCGARLGTGEVLSLADLRRLRIGLWTSIARPSRVVAALAREDLVPRVILSGSDHTAPSSKERAHAVAVAVDVWLCTPKCRTHLETELAGRPLCVLDTRIDIEAPLAAAISGVAAVVRGGAPRLDRVGASP